MRLINSFYNIINYNNNNILKDIEIAARTCYKSEYKINDESALKLVKSLIIKKHEAMLEFGKNFIFHVDRKTFNSLSKYKSENDNIQSAKFLYMSNTKLSFFKRRYIISGNVRILRDILRHYKLNKLTKSIIYYLPNILTDDIIKNNIVNDKNIFKLLNENELSYNEKLIHITKTVKFTCDRGVSHEFVRHRVCSFGQESTRYVNYTKDKHGAQCTFIIPNWILNLEEGIYKYNNSKKTAGILCNDNYSEELHTDKYIDVREWLYAMLDCEETYNKLNTIYKWTPQEARSVLTNSTKTEINIKTNLLEWQHMFKLRTSNAAHPQMYELMRPLLKDFQELYPLFFNDIKY